MSAICAQKSWGAVSDLTEAYLIICSAFKTSRSSDSDKWSFKAIIRSLDDWQGCFNGIAKISTIFIVCVDYWDSFCSTSSTAVTASSWSLLIEALRPGLCFWEPPGLNLNLSRAPYDEVNFCDEFWLVPGGTFSTGAGLLLLSCVSDLFICYNLAILVIVF